MLLRNSWRDWRNALMIVRPDTVVRWHREWLRHRWTARSRQKRPGRPQTDAAIRALIDKMASANPLWGAPRIHGELRKLGIEVSERTGSRFVRRGQTRPSQTWRTFLANHLSALVSMDFFTVPTLTGRVLFVLVLLAHDRRRVVHVSVTEHPTAEWTAQQIVAAFPEDAAPKWLWFAKIPTVRELPRRRVDRRPNENIPPHDDGRADRESATRNSLTRSMIAVGPVRELRIDLQRARRESAARLHSSAGPGWCSFAYLCGRDSELSHTRANRRASTGSAPIDEHALTRRRQVGRPTELNETSRPRRR